MMYHAFMSYSHAADGKLAPRVQSALHRLAKPFFSLRALHVFRDQTSLSATPGLWSSIARALDQSSYFILMASPEAAASPWVQLEITHWLTKSPAFREGKASEHFLIVLTDGEIQWDASAGDFDWHQTNALPQLLRGRFAEEPLYVDLRDARSDEDLSLQNPDFRARIADLAAPLHQRSKEELVGDDVRILRRNRRLGWTVGTAFGLLALAASVTAYVAMVQRDEARSREFAARAIANLEIDPERSLHHAIAAVEVMPTSEAVSALRESLLRSSLRAVLDAGSGKIIAAGFSPDGGHVVTTERTKDGLYRVRLRESASGTPRCVFEGQSGGSFDLDGREFRTDDGARYDVRTCSIQTEGQASAALELAESLPPGLETVDQAFHDWSDTVYRDSRAVLEFAYQGETPVIREVASGEVLRALRGPWDPIGGAVFSDEGGFGQFLVTWAYKALYAESGGGPTEVGEKIARLWGVRFDDTDRLLSGHRRAINTAAVGPDGEIVVTGSDDRTARVWLARSGDEFAVLRGHPAPVQRVAISPDGARVLTVSEDGTARLWEPGTVRPVSLPIADVFEMRYAMHLPELEGAESPTAVPALSTDRSTLLANVDGTRIKIWNAQSGRVLAEIADDTFGDLRGALSPDGMRVVTTTGSPRIAGGGETARIWDVATGRLVGELREHLGPVYSATFSPDGQHVITVGEDGIARLWTATSFDLERAFPVSDGRVLHAAFSADSERIVTASRDSLARVWERRSGRLLLELFGHQGGVVHASFSPDDTLIVSVGEDGTRIWDAVTGKMLGRYLGNDEPAAPFIVPDCARLVTGVYGDEGLKRLHGFGACGTVEQLLPVASRRAVGEAAAAD